MKPIIRHLMPLISLLSLITPAHAQKTPPPSYQIEVILFETTALRGWTEEYWPYQVPEVPIQDAYPIQPGVTLEIPQKLPKLPQAAQENVQILGLNTQPLQVENLETDPNTEKTLYIERNAQTTPNQNQAYLIQPTDWLLTNEAQKLTPEKGYRILIHQSWIQKGHPPKQAQPIYLENQPKTEYSSALTGTVKLYKTRYAHIEFHFNLERFIPKRIRNKFAQNQDLTDEQLPDYWTFKLQQARKIKPGQLHYIDHPIFGILVQIKRIQTP